MTRYEDIVRIANKYGYEPQSRQCIEEMAELTQAINKLWRKQNSDNPKVEEVRKARENVIEEIADVQIMLYQVAYLLDVGKEVEEEIEKKIDRQIARIEEAQA